MAFGATFTGPKTIDNAVIWTDQGQEFWHPICAFLLGIVIVDPAGHVQQVTTAGSSGNTQPTFNPSSVHTRVSPSAVVEPVSLLVCAFFSSDRGRQAFAGLDRRKFAEIPHWQLGGLTSKVIRLLRRTTPCVLHRP